MVSNLSRSFNLVEVSPKRLSLFGNVGSSGNMRYSHVEHLQSMTQVHVNTSAGKASKGCSVYIPVKRSGYATLIDLAWTDIA